MNFHLMPDQKFVDDFMNEVDSTVVGTNTYYVKGENGKLKHVKYLNIICVKSLSETIEKEIIPKAKDGDKVHIHYMDENLYKSVIKIPKNIQVGLFFWGGEIVETPFNYYAKENYDSLSYDFYLNNWHPVKRYKKGKLSLTLLLKIIARKVLFEFQMYYTHRLKTKALNRIDYFFHWNELDFEWIKKRYPKFNAKFKYHFYSAGLDEDIPSHYDKKNNKLVFWLGNSATLSNNHLDALNVLTRFKDENIVIYCPLSYGQPKESLYRDTVIREGKRLFYEKFIPLTDFMPRKEYYDLLNQVDVVIMFHNRTQGAGNNFAFVKMGKRIFMKKQSSLFSLYEKYKAHVSMTEDLNSITFNNLSKPLISNDVKNNIDILDRYIINRNKKVQTIREILS